MMADAILLIHAIFIGVVVLSVPLIIIGGWLRWKWVRNIRFRLTHIAMIAFVALEAVIGMDCPLTVWGNNLRGASDAYGKEGFIAYWLHKILFYNFPQWVFTMAYISYAILVLLLFWLVPINRKK